MILSLYISKRGQKPTNRDIIEALFPKIEFLSNKETQKFLDKPFEFSQAKGAYSIPIDPPKVSIDINYFTEMENDPIGEEIKRQYALRAAEKKPVTNVT